MASIPLGHSLAVDGGNQRQFPPGQHIKASIQRAYEIGDRPVGLMER
jgi:hypothetical protein